MEAKPLLFGGSIGALIMLIASFAYVNIVEDNGITLEPTHYCEIRGIKTYCSELTPYYGLPNGKCINPKGNLLCKSGWVEIPNTNIENPKRITCVNEGCL